MKVVVVSDFAMATGGAEKVAIDSAIGLAHAGIDVHFLAGVGPVAAELVEAGVSVHVAEVPELKHKRPMDIALSGLWSHRCADLARSLLKSLPIGDTVVHLHSWQRALTPSVVRACQTSGHPVVLTLHEYGLACPNQGFFDYQKFRICEKKALGAACLLTHCDTRTYAHKLWRAGRIAVQRSLANVPRGLTDVIYLSELSRRVLQPYFEPSTRWHAVRNPIAVERRERVAAENNCEFLFVGRVVPEKGPDLFARAAAQEAVAAVIVGDGIQRHELSMRFPSVALPGWADANGVRVAMQRARALVFPSRWYEGQPLVVQEAMANGLPAIVADRTAATDVVKDGITGLWFSHDDAGDLGACLRKLADDDALVRRLSERAHANYWQDPPTLSVHTAALQGIYAASLDRCGRSQGAVHAT